MPLNHNFCFWGFLGDVVYSERYRAITEFKEAIMKQISHSFVGLKERHGEILCCSSHLKKCSVRNGDLPEDMLQNRKQRS